ncbi:MAG: NAD(P)H-dependent oxidoreductase [Roseiarcus sp.]|jgi:hypothetical protein
MADTKILVAYFSRTGVTRRAAEALAKVLQADVEPIVDRSSRSGIAGYLRCLIEAVRQKGAPIEPARRDVASYDLVVVATPVWGASVSSPVRSYLANNRARLPDIAFLCTMGGRGDRRAFEQMGRIAGKAPRAVCALTARQVASDCERLVAGFAGKLEASQSA